MMISLDFGIHADRPCYVEMLPIIPKPYCERCVCMSIPKKTIKVMYMYKIKISYLYVRLESITLYLMLYAVTTLN